jgi:hypothetical protein
MERDSPKERRWQLFRGGLRVFAEFANGCLSGLALLSAIAFVVAKMFWAAVVWT